MELNSCYGAGESTIQTITEIGKRNIKLIKELLKKYD